MQSTALYAGLLLPGAAFAQSAAAGGTSVDLDAVDLTGQQLRDTPPGTVGYVSTRSTAATKTNTPTIEVPQSQSTVTRQQLDDRADSDVMSATISIIFRPPIPN